MKPTKPRPVVREYIEIVLHVYPRVINRAEMQETRWAAKTLADADVIGNVDADYRRPRVVSVRRVRARRA